MSGIIYKITNLINKKVYIGQTQRSIEHRWAQHCRTKRCPRLSGAIRKYGKLNFSIEEIERCETKEELNEREMFWIAFYDSTKKGYNVTNGGNSSIVHYKLSKEQENELITLKKAGYTSAQVAEMFGITVITVSEIFKRHGEELPQKYDKLEKRIDGADFKSYILLHPTLSEAMKRYDISKAGVYKYMKRLGLSKELLTSEKERESERYIKANLVKVMNLYEKGLSIRKISKIIGLARQTIAKVIEYNISKSVQHPFKDDDVLRTIGMINL